jgi:hypothetical protein
VTISASEPTTLTCPHCGRQFEAEIWTLIDSGERPDLRDALSDGTLNQPACPHCGTATSAEQPLLLHDPALKRVWFAAPSGEAEHQWRERAQSLLYALVGALPEEQRLPYLSDVQVSQGIDGLRESLQRQARRGRSAQGRQPVGSRAAPAAQRADVEQLRRQLAAQHPTTSPAPAPAAPPPTRVQPPETALPDTPLLDWIQALLAADNPAEFQALIDEHPELLSHAADALLETLIAEAQRAREPEIAKGIQSVRATLATARAGEPSAPIVAAPVVPELLPSVVPPLPAGELPGQSLSDAAYQATILADSPEALFDATRDHPMLLEPWAIDELARRTEAALEDGHERLAADLDERREVLAAIQQEQAATARLMPAIEAFLHAGSEDAMAELMSEHPALLTDAAQEALVTIAADARAQSDYRLATTASQRQTMLREVRSSLDAT